MIILIDKDEKRPYTFSEESKVVKLKTGDYSIEGHEDLFCIERKSLDDYVSSLLLDRFFAEISRMTKMTSFIVIEGSLPEIYAKKYTSDITPESVIGKTLAILICYKVPIIFCTDRQHALKFVEHTIKKYINDKSNKRRSKTKNPVKRNSKEDLF